MPNTKSAIKRTKISAKKAVNNSAAKSAMRTAVKKARTAISTKDENKEAIIKATNISLDKASAKGIIHKNTAARKKSRLAKASAKTQA